MIKYYIIKKVSKIYLISDILYNSKNMNINSSWRYKRELEEFLPDIFEEFNKEYMYGLKLFRKLIGSIISESIKDKLLNILNIWKEWSIFDSKYIEGLESSFLRKKRERDDLNKEIKSELEQYEDEIIEIYSKSKTSIQILAKENGLSSRGELRDIMSRLICLKEYKLNKELAIVFSLFTYRQRN